MTIVAAADGSALGNPGPAGWAWYVDDDCWGAGGWPHGTNNMGELMAVLDLLRQTAHLPQEPLHILCDSQYVINSVTKWMPGWKRKGWRKSDGKPVLNVELLKDIDAALVGRTYTFEWVKGHAGHHLNEAADDRARAAATAYQAKKAPAAGPGFAGAAPNSPQPDSPQPLATSAAVRDRAATQDRLPVRDKVAAQEPEQLDLFASVDDAPDPAFLPADGAAVRGLIGLEQELMDPRVRADASQVAALLHPDFAEIGASGRTWGRAEILTALAADTTPAATFEVISLEQLEQDTALLLYRTVEQHRSVLRSSLWRRERGRWQLRFHQGTPEA